MRKLLIGCLIVAVLAVGGYFGVTAYVQHRAEQEVEATFAAMRTRGTAATHGAVSFDLWSRTLVVSDIAVAAGGDSNARLTIARIEARGVSQPAAGRVAASRVELSDLEARYAPALPVTMTMTYKIPRAVLDGFSGPSAPLRPVDTGSYVDATRFWLEHFNAMTLTSLSIPAMAAQAEPMPSDRAIAIGPANYAYTGIALRELRNGRLGAATIERMSMKTAAAGANPATMELEVSDVAALDFDGNAMMTIFDPARAKDDNYYRVYRQATTGAYTARIGRAATAGAESVEIRLAGAKVEGIGLNPSKLQIQELLALIQAMQAMPATGAQPSAAAGKAVFDQMARAYEGIRIGSFEMSGFGMTVADKTSVTLASIRLTDLANGRLGEFAIEGFDVTGGPQPVKIGRFALKSFALAELMRTTAEWAMRGAPPSPDQVIGLLRFLGGVDVSGVVAPYKATGATITIDALAASWGEFVGPVPTKARVSAKLVGPIVPEDGGLYHLLGNSDISSLAVALDLGAAWDEKAGTLALAPAAIEIGGLFKGSARASLGGVSRDVVAADPNRRMMATVAVRVAPIEITVSDLGFFDVTFKKYASEHNTSPEEARRQAVEDMRTRLAELAASNPDLPPVIEAFADFVGNPRGTLTVRITPTGNVPLLALITASQQNPAAALANFRITAATTH